jgi:hypothetical protein
MTAVLVVTAILIAVSAPAILTARSHRLPGTMYRFLIAAVGFGVVIGYLDARYRAAYTQCKAEGLGRCVNDGFNGLEVMVVVGFLVTSMVRSYQIYNN